MSSSSAMSSLNKHIRLAPEVRDALARGAPVVALESTIISHGMPYPKNVETALEVEGVIRDGGAVPATIAILGGVIHVGLEREQLELLGKLGQSVTKTSRRDLAVVVARRGNGATTVAGTMLVASMVDGVKVFVTGGIGGVHRDGENTMDVSADLTELGRTPIAVVCAGAKSILDIPRTLEVLETQGVTVAAVGTDEYPAFFTCRSGCTAPLRVDTPAECAAIINANDELALRSGMLFAVPVPEAHAAEAQLVEDATQRALNEANEQKVLGRDITPFLLARINELTGGKSLESNIHLVKNNARLGAAIAVHLCKLRAGDAASSAPAPAKE